MKTVLKWNVPVDDQEHEIGGGKVVMVACQYGPESVQVWTEDDAAPDHLVRWRMARVYGTGHTIDTSKGITEHLGSAITAGGQLVWHVYGRQR